MLSAFTASLLLVTISELGDKTFFIAMVLAMRHRRRWVLAGVVSALAAMTILSVMMGQAVSFLPKVYLHYAEIVLFLGFGIKLLYDASRMKAPAKVANAHQRCTTSDAEEEAAVAVAKAEARLQQATPIMVCVEAFTLTFLAEWGDRTQIATIALAASNNPIGVTLGAILGHTLCALIAVIGGCLIAGRISEQVIVALGGVLFLIFGTVAWWEGV
jgi:putative Ca2+/H+ antiporter (TMEM165/GDT1 family)